MAGAIVAVKGWVHWQEAAKRSGRTEAWIRKHIWVDRDIEAGKFGGHTYLPEEEVARIAQPTPLAPRKPRVAVQPVKTTTRHLSAAAIQASREVAAKSRMHSKRRKVGT